MSLLQIPQQVDHLRLYKHIQSACWLVEYDEGRLQNKCTSKCNTLTLAAGEFMRIAVAGLRIQPDIVQRSDDALLSLGPRQPRMMNPQALFDDVRYRHAWRQ